MIRRVIPVITAPVRQIRARVRELREDTARANRAATSIHRGNLLLARELGVDLDHDLDSETINEAVFGRSRPSRQRRGKA